MYWSNVVYNACDGRPESITELKKYDVYDFFLFVENFIQRNKPKKE